MQCARSRWMRPSPSSTRPSPRRSGATPTPHRGAARRRRAHEVRDEAGRRLAAALRSVLRQGLRGAGDGPAVAPRAAERPRRSRCSWITSSIWRTARCSWKAAASSSATSEGEVIGAHRHHRRHQRGGRPLRHRRHSRRRLQDRRRFRRQGHAPAQHQARPADQGPAEGREQAADARPRRGTDASNAPTDRSSTIRFPRWNRNPRRTLKGRAAGANRVRAGGFAAARI